MGLYVSLVTHGATVFYRELYLINRKLWCEWSICDNESIMCMQWRLVYSLDELSNAYFT